MFRKHRTASVEIKPKSGSGKPKKSAGAKIKIANKPKRSVKWRLLYWTAVLCVWAVVFVVGAIGYYAIVLPNPYKAVAAQHPPSIKILSDDGSLIANHGVQKGFVKTEDISPFLIDAVLSIEDSRFYDHYGFDPIGMFRAIYANLRAGDIVQGGSTLTQQLVKNIYLSSNRTFARKFQEALIGSWLEMSLTKHEILELYLNSAYFGAGTYGIKGAADRYFGKAPKDLTLAEAALLAGLLKAPSRYSPTEDVTNAYQRSDTVLGRMVTLGKISQQDRINAMQNPPEVFASGHDEDLSYAIDWIVEILPGFIGNSEDKHDKDLVVYTSINIQQQKLLQRTVALVMTQQAQAFKAQQAAAVMMDQTGSVKAIVGGRSYRQSPFNRAVKALRQPGSSFKPFIYLSALEAGYHPESVVYDYPVNVNGWRPQNYSGGYSGRITLREALAKSVNTVAVRLFMKAGQKKVTQVARRLGITSNLSHNPTLALGTSEVTLLEMTAAYVPFSNGGYGAVPFAIHKVSDTEGNILYERYAPDPRRVASAHIVKQMNNMLSAVIYEGTGRDAFFEGQMLAGKTGTSQSYRDAWFLGYTPYYTLGIWVGNDNNQSMNRVTGGSLPADIWRFVMQRVHNGLPSKPMPGAMAQMR